MQKLSHSTQDDATTYSHSAAYESHIWVCTLASGASPLSEGSQMVFGLGARLPREAEAEALGDLGGILLCYLAARVDGQERSEKKGRRLPRSLATSELLLGPRCFGALDQSFESSPQHTTTRQVEWKK